MQKETAKLSLWGRTSLTLTLLGIPFVVLYAAVTASWTEGNKNRPKGRAIFDAVARYVTSNVSIQQLQSYSAPTFETYNTWLKTTNLAPVVDDLENGVRLMWIGPKRTDHVVLYCHGGGFVGPLSDFQLEYWHRVQTDILKRPGSPEIGVAVLQYSLLPKTFPTQLVEVNTAVKHLLSTGVHPSNLYLAGESAGANIILQLISHTLHPVPSVPTSPLTDISALGGIYLMSPWVSLTGVGGSHKVNDRLDLVSAKTLGYWGTSYLAGIPESQLVYAQAGTVSDGWFSGIDKHVSRILITAGDSECLRDDIVAFNKSLQKLHPNVKFDLQDGGVHADPVFDIAAKSKKLSPVTEMVIDWLADGIVDADEK